MAGKKRTSGKRHSSLNLFPQIQLFLALLLILVGASLLIYPATKKALVASQPPQSTVALDQAQQKPTKVYIPKLNRTLFVTDGYFHNNRWIVSDTGVSYYTDSALPGQTGNTVIYGHNTRDKLGGLWRVDNGDYVYIILTDGSIVKYQVFEEKEIKPTQVEILAKTSDSRLTLYTCSGFLDTARFVVIANLVTT